ncbi:MAG: MurR/RpiR family transcriptional regulator [Paracoccus sp. (in: a-proteobacteria)]|uniref:MurR/RpiR family transcriptional regulator n=1 Tax=Paracoccus sp. TaxID=267 RepID=UPI0039187FD2
MERRKSLLSRVRASLNDLHPAERKLALLLCDFPGELASYSARELAALAGVSNATVTRFVRRLGYDSYEEARRHARAESETGSRLYLSPAPDQSISAPQHVEQSVLNIQRTMAVIDPAAVDEVARSIVGARKVWVIGFRASHPFASYLQWQLTQITESIVAIPNAGQTLGEHLVDVRPEDCVIFFGLRRRVAMTEQILTEVEARGAPVLFVTDEGAPVRTSAAWHFRCQTGAAGPLFDHSAVMVLCHLIASRAIEMAQADGRDRLRRIEMLNDALSEL